MKNTMTKIQNYRKRLNKLFHTFRHFKKRKKEEARELERHNALVITNKDAQSIIQSIAQNVQESVHVKIASVVTTCIKEVFKEKPYDFKIEFERSRGRTSAVLYFERDGNRVDPKTASGGGVIDVAALALRIVCILLSRPKKRRLVILDEPFRFVSPYYQPRVVEMVTRLAEEMEVQFIIVTNIPDLAIGKVIHIH